MRRDEGAETLEFALVAPVLLVVVYTLVYALLLSAAQLSLAHAASVAARYVSLPQSPLSDTYPDHLAGKKIDESTPFFTERDCTTLVNGVSPAGPPVAAANAPVVVDVSCAFPNPLGRALGGLGDTLTVTARAEQRRE